MNAEIRQIEKREAAQIAPQLLELYKIAGWADADATDYSFARKVIENSFVCFGAFDDGRLAGFFRALSDGVSDAYLLELAVRKEYRRNGIGARLTDAIVKHLKTLGIGWIMCVSVPSAVGVYARTGERFDGVPFVWKS